ncbi:MAG: LysR family transcriptional regulator [Vicinamibacterales bacterium]
MSAPDLNLLVTLNAVLSEGSVTRAARRLRLSPSAMSRALARLRETTGDPLLVRAGRGLVPTPRALELRERVAQLVEAAEGVLRPADRPALQNVVRIVTLRASEGFAETFGPALIARVASDAPGIRLRFVPKLSRDSAALRDGLVDLETGVVGATTSPELREVRLFSDRFVAVMRRDHTLARVRLTARRYASCGHVAVSRRGQEKDRIDDVLDPLGVSRRIVTIVSGFGTAIAIARGSRLIATVPERHTAGLRTDLRSVPLPFAVPPIVVSLIWHPRMHADPVHAWLRTCVQEVCGHAGTSV